MEEYAHYCIPVHTYTSNVEGYAVLQGVVGQVTGPTQISTTVGFTVSFRALRALYQTAQACEEEDLVLTSTSDF